MSNFGDSEDLLIAVPKKGRLYEKVCKILQGAGLYYVRQHRRDIARCSSENVTIVFLPAHDIATYVAEGNVDMGITGEDIIAETEADIEVLLKLDMGKCRVAFQVPKASGYKDPKELVGKRIVTSFPVVTRKFLDKIDPEHTTKIKYVTGSVEIAPSLGLADAVVDLVETGTTMQAAGLMEAGTIMETQTVLIANHHSKQRALIEKLRGRIEGYITAVKHTMISYNCPKDKIEEAAKITPGRHAPTVTLLHDKGFVSITALVYSKDVPSLMDELKAVGAESIVSIPITNCRF